MGPSGAQWNTIISFPGLWLCSGTSDSTDGWPLCCECWSETCDYVQAAGP